MSLEFEVVIEAIESVPEVPLLNVLASTIPLVPLNVANERPLHPLPVTEMLSTPEAINWPITTRLSAKVLMIVKLVPNESEMDETEPPWQKASTMSHWPDERLAVEYGGPPLKALEAVMVGSNATPGSVVPARNAPPLEDSGNHTAPL